MFENQAMIFAAIPVAICALLGAVLFVRHRRIAGPFLRSGASNGVDISSPSDFARRALRVALACVLVATMGMGQVSPAWALSESDTPSTGQPEAPAHDPGKAAGEEESSSSDESEQDEKTLSASDPAVASAEPEIAAFGGIVPASAYTVTTAAELQAAIDSALGSSPTSDTIVISNGFTIDSPISVNNALGGPDHLNIIGGSTVTLSAGVGARHFTVENTSTMTFTLTLSDFVVTGCSAAEGGGLFLGLETTASYDAITLAEVTFSDNTSAGDGGAVYAMRNLAIMASTMQNNHASGSGGAVYATSRIADQQFEVKIVMDAPYASPSSFTGNTAGADGGALCVTAREVPGYANLLMEGARLQDNAAAGDGGAIFLSSVLMANFYADYINTDSLHTDIIDNEAGGSGGGIYLDSDESVTCFLRNIGINGNKAAGDGGGIALRTLQAAYLNVYGYNYDYTEYLPVEISDNTAGGSGGGIYASTLPPDQDGQMAYFTASGSFVLSRNSAQVSGGGMCLISGAYAYASLHGNCIVEYNEANGGDGGGIAISGGLYSSLDMMYYDPNDPDNTGWGSISNNRAQGRGGGVYCKANEYGSWSLNRYKVDNNEASGDGGGAYISTRGSLTLNASGGWDPSRPPGGGFSGNISGGDGGGLCVISDTARSMYLSYVSIDDNKALGNGGGVYTGGLEGSLGISGSAEPTLAGTSVSRNSAGGSGGGVCAQGFLSSLTTSGVLFEGNVAEGGRGGALYYDSDDTFEEEHWAYFYLGYASFIRNTSTGDGGAIFLGDAPENIQEVVSLYLSTFADNVSSGGSGGALYIGEDLYALDVGYTPDELSYFSRNTAAYDGGAVYIRSLWGSSQIMGTQFQENNAGRNGGGLYVDSATPDSAMLIQSAVFEGNRAGLEGGGIWFDYGSLSRLFVDPQEADMTVFTGNTAAYEAESLLLRFPDDIVMHEENIHTDHFSERPPWSPLGTGMFQYGYNNYDINYRSAYLVTFDGNGNTGGTVPIDHQAYLPGDVVVVAGAGDLVREGYTFAGWSFTPDGSSPFVGPFTMGTSPVILYAVWIPSGEPLPLPTTGDGVAIGATVLLAALAMFAATAARRRAQRFPSR